MLLIKIVAILVLLLLANRIAETHMELRKLEVRVSKLEKILEDKKL